MRTGLRRTQHCLFGKTPTRPRTVSHGRSPATVAGFCRRVQGTRTHQVHAPRPGRRNGRPETSLTPLSGNRKGRGRAIHQFKRPRGKPSRLKSFPSVTHILLFLSKAKKRQKKSSGILAGNGKIPKFAKHSRKKQR